MFRHCISSFDHEQQHFIRFAKTAECFARGVNLKRGRGWTWMDMDVDMDGPRWTWIAMDLDVDWIPMDVDCNGHGYGRDGRDGHPSA